MAKHETVNRSAWVARRISLLGSTLIVALLPKCPLCIAAYLAAFGLSASAAGAAALLVRPAAWSLAAMAVGAFVFAGWRARKMTSQPVATDADCCGHSG
jgi:hypothetical protein